MKLTWLNLSKFLSFLSYPLNLLLLALNPLYVYFTYAYPAYFSRLRKSPYADSYWFLYSTKVTYFTTRYLNNK